MIPFFRKIRKTLADDNRPLKYMRYAIGEIVLVVIGILIALQINNWNENRKTHLNELKLAEQLLDDARADSIFFESRIIFQQMRDTLFNNLITLSKDISVDSILKLKVNIDPFGFRLVYQSNLINNNPDAYDLMDSYIIKNKLREYIKSYDYVVNAIELNNRICEEYGIPLKIKYYEQLSKSPNSYPISDLSFALSDKETVAKFAVFKEYGTNYFILCQEFLKVNHELILLIEKYLKENQ